MSDHIPDPGQHRTLFYGEYSSRVRGTTASDADRGHRGAAAEASLLCKLGQDDREGLPRGSARLPPLRPAHEHPRLRERSALHRQNPRTPRLAPAGAGQAPARLARSSASPSRARVGACRPAGTEPGPPALPLVGPRPRDRSARTRRSSPCRLPQPRNTLRSSAARVRTASHAHPVGPPGPLYPRLTHPAAHQTTYGSSNHLRIYPRLTHPAAHQTTYGSSGIEAELGTPR